MRVRLLVIVICCVLVGAVGGGGELETDVIETDGGPLTITFIGHGTLMLEWDGSVIHVDPWTRLAHYGELPDADLILITHEHRDHLDPKAVAAVRTESTRIVGTDRVCAELDGCLAIGNGETITMLGLPIRAVPAYNVVHTRRSGEPYHPEGVGNGYVISFGGTTVYIAGDTENTPEMKALQGIDVAFLPMNIPYTMTPEMVADAARAFCPAILYPYHYGETDPQRLVELLEEEADIEVRVRSMR